MFYAHKTYSIGGSLERDENLSDPPTICPECQEPVGDDDMASNGVCYRCLEASGRVQCGGCGVVIHRARAERESAGRQVWYYCRECHREAQRSRREELRGVPA